MIRSTAIRTALVGLSMVVIAACGDKKSTVAVSAATYNAGLAPGFILYVDERAPLLADLVADIDADVLCVQEFFLDEHWQALESAAAERYPNTVRLENDPGEPMTTEESSCTNAEADPMLACALENCADASPGDLAGCFLGACGTEFNAASGTCQGCLAANLGKTLDEIFGACVMGSAAYVYEGSFGTGLLSKHEILEEDSLLLESNITRRGVIYANLNHPEAGSVHVFCTHLTSAFANSTVPFPEEGGTWEEEQAQQIRDMLAWIEEKAGTGKVILLGDMNTGPDIPEANIVADVQENYPLFFAGGFWVPYPEQLEPQCSYCGDNNLVGEETEGIDSVLIDHIMLRGLEAEVQQGERIIDEQITLSVDGEDLESFPSDHFGIRLDIDITED